MSNESVSVYRSFVLSLYRGFMFSYQNWNMSNLDSSSMVNPVYRGLLSITDVLVSSRAARVSLKMRTPCHLGQAVSFLSCFSVLGNLTSLRFLTFSIVFPNTELFNNLNKS